MKKLRISSTIGKNGESFGNVCSPTYRDKKMRHKSTENMKRVMAKFTMTGKYHTFYSQNGFLYFFMAIAYNEILKSSQYKVFFNNVVHIYYH